jgi:hypothetical protein
MTKTILWLDDLRNPEERIWLDKLIEFGINTSYFTLENYQSHPTIKALLSN